MTQVSDDKLWCKARELKKAAKAEIKRQIGVLIPTEEARRLHDLAKHYHEVTEAYDKTVCGSIDGKGIAIPTTGYEQRAINQHALSVLQGLVHANLDISREDLMAAIRVYANETYNK